MFIADKGDGSDIEAVQDDVLFLDEAYKSHLASIKRVSLLHLGLILVVFLLCNTILVEFLSGGRNGIV